MSKKSLAARLLTRVFRTRLTDPIRKPDAKPQGAVGSRIEELEDRSVPAGFIPGTIQGQDGWGGGTGAISPSVDQGVNQSGAYAHTGVGALRISNNTSLGNHNGAFGGWVFGPGLDVAAGQPSSSAGGDLFTATYWIKPGSATADGSNLEMDLGTVPGDDRNTFMAFTNRADADGGLVVRMAEPDGATGNFLATQIVATNLDRTLWHRIDITARFYDGVANDTFSVSLDGTPLINPRTLTAEWGTFEGYRNGLGQPYALSNRMYFRSGAAPSAYGAFSDTAAQGFSIDDLSYRVATQLNPTATLDSYYAAFETQPTVVYVNDDWVGVGYPNGTVIPDADPATGGNQQATIGTDAFATIQAAVDAVAAGGTVVVNAGLYTEDVIVNKAGVSLLGAGAADAVISGAIGGVWTSTVTIAASNVTVAGFSITREGNNTTDWNNPGLNTAGLSIQGAFTGAVIRDNLITGNRSGIDINNSSGHTVRNNVITDNRTGLIFRNQTDNLTVIENAITNNWTVGIVFLDASGGTNSPVQTAANSTFRNNSISGNWYGQVVDRQSGGSLPVPGSNVKDFSGNWFGSASPTTSTANSAEPGYAAQIPVAFGGTATSPPPGTYADILGPASANIDFSPYLNLGTDTNVETTAGQGTYGFQGDFSNITVTTAGAQAGPTGRIQNGVDLLADGSLVGGARVIELAAGTYAETAVLNKSLTLHGAAAFGSLVAPTTGAQQTVLTVAATNVTIDRVAVQINQGDDAGIAGTAPIAPVGIGAVGPAPGNVADFTGLVIKNSRITSIGDNAVQWTGSPGLSLRAAGIVLYDSPGGGVASVTLTNNSVDILSGTSFFQRAVWLAQLNATITGNTFRGAANDLNFQFPSGGPSTITGNTFSGYHVATGGGVLIGDPNGNAPVLIGNNQFTPVTLAGVATESLIINRNAATGSAITVSGNTFTGFNTGVIVGGARDVVVNGNNVFTPKAGAVGFVAVAIDSRNLSNNTAPGTPINTTVDGNTFNTAAGATGTAVTVANNTPAADFSTGVSVGLTADNTYAAGLTAGVAASGGAVTVSDTIGGAVTGVAVTGGSVTVVGSTLGGNTTGIAATGPGSVTLGAGNAITGGATGLSLSGATAGLGGLTLNNTAFAGQSGQYVSLASGALGGAEITGTAATFGGLTGAAATLAQNYAIEDKIAHATDAAGLGFVRVKAGNVFVTTSSSSIQRGVDAAVGGDVINVGAGTYAGDVDASAKTLTLRVGETSPATVTITGNLVLGANTTVETRLNSAASVDKWVVTGSTTRAGTLKPILGYAPASEQTYLVIDSTTTSGSFASVSASVFNAVTYSFTASPSPGDVILTEVNFAPVVTTSPGALPYGGLTPIFIDPGLLVSDTDSANLASATVQITSNFVSGQDVLSYTGTLPVGVSADTSVPGTITFTGPASPAAYETLLRSVRYQNTSPAPSTATRTVTFTVNDGATTNNTASAARNILVSDTVKPTAVIAPVTTTPTTAVFTVTFSEAVSGLTGTDFIASISDGTVGTPTVGAPSGNVYTITVPVATGYGTVSLGLPADAVIDTATPANGNVASNTGTITFKPLVTLSVSAGPATETGTTVTVTATLTVPVAANQSVAVGQTAGTALAADFTLAAAITIAAGQSSGAVTFTAANDAVLEASETATLTISAPSAGLALGATVSQVVSITDDETATLTIEAMSAVAEGTNNPQAAGRVTLAITGTQTGSAAFTLGDGLMVVGSVTAANGTAGGGDYENPGTQSVTFTNVGPTVVQSGDSGTVALTIHDDNRVEGPETILLALALGASSPGLAGRVNTGNTANVTTVADNDAAVIRFVSATDSVAELNSGSASKTVPVELVITASGGGPVGLDVAVTGSVTITGGTATGGSDYTGASPQSVTFNPGEGATIAPATQPSVSVNGDVVVEADETVTFAVAHTGGPATADGGGHALTITNEDSATVSVSTGGAAAESGDRTFTVTLSNPVDTAVTVRFDTTSGTATAGSDYTAVVNQTVTFNPMVTSQVVTVTVTNDARLESDETLPAQIGTLLTTYAGSVTLGTTTAAGTITDDETAAVSFDAATNSVVEGNVVVPVGVTLALTTSPGSTGLAGLDRNVVARITDTGTGSATNAVPPGDYTFATTDVTFAAGSNGTSITGTPAVAINVTEDFNTEGDETVVLSAAVLSANGTVTTTAPPVTHTLTIQNDDTIRTYDATVAGDYTLKANGANLELYRGAVIPANLVASGPIAGPALVINGVSGAGQNDTLTIDFSGGSPIPPDGVTWNGGTGASDKLVLTGGAATTATHTFTGPTSGTITYSGLGTVHYTELEPVDESGMSVTDRVFSFPAGANTASLANAGANLKLSSTGPTFEEVTFANPSGSLTITGAGGDDSLTVGTASNLTASLAVGSAAAPFASMSVTGAVALGSGKSFAATAASITTTASITTLDGGPITLTADDLSIGGTVSGTGSPGALIWAKPLTANRPIDVGTETSGKLSLTAAEMAFFTTGLRLGATAAVGGTPAGAILVTDFIDFGPLTGPDARGLSLVTAGSVTNELPGDGIKVNGLYVTAASFDFSTSTSSSVGFVGGNTAGAFRLRTSSPNFLVVDAGDLVTGVTAGGAVELTNTEAGLNGVIRTIAGGITSGGNPVTLTADELQIVSPVNAGSALVTLRPFTAGQLINLGNDVSGQLGLTDTELDAITAGTIQVGDVASGAVTVSAPISPAAAGALGLTSGSAVTVNATVTVTGTTTINAPTVNLNANVVNAVTGTTATTVTVAAPGEIQDGVNVAASGATLTVAAGTYAGDVNVNKSLTLRGNQFGVNPNDGSWNDTRTNLANESVVRGAVNLSLQNNIVMDGFTLERTATNEGHILIGSGNPTGVGATSSFDIRNTRFVGTRGTGTAWAGIHTNFLNDAGNTLPGNQFTATQNRFQIAGSGSGAGILVNANRPGSDNLGGTTITNNYVTGSPSNGLNVNRPGGYLTLTGNYLVNDDIFTFQIHNAVISGNTVINSPQGSIQVVGSASEDSSNVTVSNNTIINNVANSVAALQPSYAQIDVRGPLSGTNTITGNSVTLSGTLPANAFAIYGVRVRNTGGAGVGNLTVSNNSLDGGGIGGTGNANLPPVSGVFIDTDLLTSALDLHVVNNVLTGWVNGVSVYDTNGAGPGAFGGLPTGSTVEFANNSVSGTSGLLVASGAGEVVNASGNWWGSSVLATVSAGMSGPIDYTPYLGTGTDTSVAAGFQGDFSDLVVHTLGAQTGATPRITEGYNALTATGMLRVTAGTYTETVNLGAGADKAVTLAPGNSPGQVTLNGNLTLSANDTLAVEIGGTNAATDYDNVLVTGAVTLGGATLSLAQFGGFSVNPAVLQAYTIVSNDDTDAVTGIFAGLPEGTPIAYAGGTVYISYGGGDGNDVVLYSQPVINGTPGADTFVLRQVNASPGVFEMSVNGAPFVNLGAVNVVTVNGLAGNDSLTIDYVNGTAMPAGGVAYNGGPDADVLVVTRSGGSFTATTVTHTLTSTSAGSVDVDGRAVSYTGLETPTTDGLTAVNRVFTFNGGAETISVTDPVAADGFTRVASTAGLAVDFRNPTAALVINAGTGDDTVTVTAVDGAYNAALTIHGDAATDTVNLNAAITYAAGNNLTVTAESITVTAAQTLSGAGAVSLTAGRNIAVSGAIGTAAGSILLDADTGAQLAGNFIGVDISANVTSATGTVTVEGRGGDTGNSQHGVRVSNGAVVSGGSAGTATSVTGVGGAGSGLGSYGVFVVSSGQVNSSGDGAVSVVGSGSTGGSHHMGVRVEAGGLVSSGGAGTVTVTGTGGNNSARASIGVDVFGGTVTSGGGAVVVTGNSGSSGVAGDSNYGVVLDIGGVVTSGPGGTVNVAGTAGAGDGDFNYGVYVFGAGASLSSGGGAVVVSGTGGGSGSSTTNSGVYVDTNGAAIPAPAGLTVNGTRGANTTQGILVSSSGAISAVGLATLNGPSGSDIFVLSGATANFGSLTFTTTGLVSITEDSQTDLAGTNTAGTLSLTSAALLTNLAAASLTVTGNANLSATSVSLGDQTGDAMNFGSLTFVVTGPVTIREDSSTLLTNTSQATALTLSSTAGIANGSGATLTVTGVADFSGTSVALGDQSGDTMNFGSLTVSSSGPVDVREDSGMAVNTVAGTTINLSSTGAISDTNAGAVNVTGTSLTASAATGIDLDTTIGTLTSASVSGTGGVSVRDTAGGLVVTTATTANGSITLTAAGGDLTLTSVSAGNGGVVATTTTSGNVLVGSVTAATTAAITAAGAINESGGDPGADIVATSATLSAVGGIGNLGTLEVDLATLTSASTTGTNAPIDLADTAGGLSVTSATTTDGAVTLSAASLTLTTVNAGGTGRDILATATSGGIAVGAVSADGDTVTLSAAGAITDTNGGTLNLTALNVALTAAGGIGSGDALETNATNVAFQNTGGGDVELTELAGTGGFVVNSVGALTTSSNTAGAVVLVASSPITFAVNTSGTSITAQAIEAGAGTVNADDITVNAGVLVSATAGSVVFESGDAITINGAVAASDDVTLRSGVAGTDNDGAITLNGPVTAGDTVTLDLDDDTAGAAQAAGGTVTAATLRLLGAGPFLLDVPTNNDVDAVTANVGGKVNYTDADGFAVGAVTTTNDDVTLVADAGNITLGAHASLGSGALRLQTNGTTSAITQTGGTITAATLGLRAGSGGISLPNGLNDVDTIAATTTGAFQSRDADGFAIGTVTADRDFTPAVTGITAAGDLTFCLGGPLAITSPINAAGQTVRIKATSVSQTAGGTITAAALGIESGGAIDLSAATNDVDTIAFRTTAAGNVDFANAGGLTVGTVTAGTSCITSDVSGVTAADGSVALSNVTSGSVVLAGAVSAAANAVSITSSAGAIVDDAADAVTDVTAGALTLSALTGIGSPAGGSLDTNVASVTAAVTGAGAIDLNEANDVTLTSVTTANGPITVVAGGSVVATSVVSSTDADANDVVLTATSGDITVATITAGTGASADVTLAAAGSILDDGSDGTAITADVLTLTATAGSVGGSGILPDLDTAANSITAAAATGAWVTETDAVTLTSVTTTNGPVVVAAGGAMTATLVTAGGTGSNATLTTAAGGIAVGVVTAAGDTVTLTAAGAVTDGNGAAVNVVAGVLSASAGTGIDLDTTVTTVSSATVSGTGAIDLRDTAGGLVVTLATTNAGSIALTAAGGDLALVSVTAGGAGDVTASTTTTGDVVVGLVTADGNTVTLTAAGAITDGDTTANDIDALNAALTAATGIGSAANPLELTVTTLAATTGTGGVFATDLAGGLVVGTVGSLIGVSVTGLSGNVVVTASSPLTVNAPVTGPGAIDLTAGNSAAPGDDLTLNANVASSGGGTITLTAGDNILHTGGTVGTGGTVRYRADAEGTNTGAITQGAGTALSAADVVFRSGGAVSYTLGTNSVATLAAGVTGAGAAFAYFDQTGLAVGTVDGLSGITTSNGDVQLRAVAGDITLAQSIAAGTATVRLQADAGGVAETGGTVTAGALGVRAQAGAVAFGNANDVDTLAAFASGSVAFVNAGGLTIGTVTGVTGFTATTGVSTTNGTISVTNNTAGGLTVAQAVGAGGASAVVLDANGAGGDLNVNAAVTSAGGSVTLTADDDVTFNAGGDVASNNGNVVITGNADASGAGAVTMDADTAVNAGTGTIAVSAAGDVTLGDLTTTNATALAVTVTSTAGGILDAGTDADAEVTADAPGAVVTLTANAGGIGGSGAAATIETTVAELVAASATGIWVTDATGLTVTSAVTADGPIELQAGGAMTATLVAAGGNTRDVRLTTTAGGIAVDEVTAAGDGVLIDAAGAVTDLNGANPNVAAQRLLVRAGGGIDLDTTVSTLAAVNGGGAVDVANVGSLTVDDVTLFGVTAAGVTNIAAGGTTTTVSAAAAGSNALLLVNDPVAGRGTVTLASDQDLHLDAAVSAVTGSVLLDADLAADAGVGAGVIVNAAVSGVGVTVTTGNDPDTVTVTLLGSIAAGSGAALVQTAGGADAVVISGPVTGATATVLTGAAADSVTVNATASNQTLTVDGGDAGDTFTVNASATLQLGTVALADTGATGTDALTVNGTGGVETFDMNNAAAGARNILVSGASAARVTYTTALERATLAGAAGGDTYNVDFAQGAGSSLPTEWTRIDAGSGADTANLSGTTTTDTMAINVLGALDRVTSSSTAAPGGEAVDYTGALETLNVYGRDEGTQPGDTFSVRPDNLTAIKVFGGTPTVYPGDTLEVDLVGLVTLNPTFSDPALPNGTLSLTGYPTPALAWDGIENFPVPRGMGGSFDFGTPTSPVQFGYTRVTPSRSYPAAATEGTGWHGWATTPQYGNLAYDETNLPPAVAASPVVNLLRDYAYGFQTALDVGVFRVDVAPNTPVQLTAILGTPGAPRDGQVVEWGVANTPTGLPTAWTAITPATGTFTAAGEMTSVSAVLSAANIGNNLSLFVRFRDLTGEPYWSVSALDVRPTNPGAPTLLPGGLVAPLPVRREFSTTGAAPPVGEATYANQHAFAALPADGATIDYYRGKDAIPNSLVTVTVTNGTVADAAFTAGDTALGTRVLDADAAGYFRSFQVQADAAGEFTFGVRRPTGTATSTVTVADPTGFRAGAFTQAFVLPTTRRIDFGPLPGATTTDYGNGGPVGVGYTPFATAAYGAATALGWSAAAPLPIAFTPGGTGVTAVQADGVYGGYAPSEFVLDMPAGSYVVTATLGDASARRDDVFVEVFDGSAWVPAKGFNPATGAYDTDLTGLTSPAGVSPNAGQSMARTFLLTTTNNAGGVGQLRVRFGNVTGNPNWSLSALDVRPAQAGLTVTRTSAAPTADGTTVSTYQVTGAAEGTVLTVRPALGAVATADANTTYDGFQVVVPPSGTATFSVTAPFSTTAASSIIEVESVAGAERGTVAESYAASPPPPPAGVPAVRRFDFNGPGNDTNPNMTGVRGSEVWATGADYGWLSAVAEFERATATLPASMTAAQKSLFRDGATLGGPKGTFRVKVSDAGADYAVRYYVGDSAKKWPWIRLQVEGGAASGQLPTNVNQYWSYVMFGKDLDADGYLDVSIFGSATWVLNAIDVAKGTTAAALPPSLIPPAPQAAAFAVTSGTAPTLTRAELAPIVAEATRRWVAAGADPARLAAVTVSITDLNAAGRLGEHVPGSVHVDDDAGGRGWFVDATPADDAEFGSSVAVGLGATGGAAAKGVDLLTVVMHELGHELGLADLSASPADLMAETLDVGVRRLPALPSVAVPVELPTVAATPAAVTVTLPAPALWLDKAETVYSPGVAVAATTDAVRVTTAEPAAARAEAVKVALPPAFTTTAAWPDADALLDLDGVYVG